MKVYIGPYPGKNDAEREVKIELDPYDSWNADNTIALIAVPLIKQLKATNHGSAFTDDEDVPEHLRSTAPGAMDGVDVTVGDLDKNFNARWDWVQDEMIWALERVINDDDAPYDQDNDYVAQRAYEERVRNGLKLFGKYFQNLWD